MKTSQLNNRRAWGTAMTLGGCAIIAMLTLPVLPIAGAAEAQKENAEGFMQRLKEWQERMSDTFRDTFKGWQNSQGKSDSSSVSADLREQSEAYTLRLSLPNRTLSKVEVTLENGSLHIVAPEEGNARRYEQTMTLTGVAAGAKLQVDRRQEDHLIVVTVPKGQDSGLRASPRNGSPEPWRPFFESDREIMESMDRMRREMDRLFEDSFKGFRSIPEFKGFFDEHRFGSTYTVDDEGDHFMVRTYLPDRDMNHVNVSIDGQTLQIEAKAEESTSKPEDEKNFSSNRKALYTQRIALPGPVQPFKMKVDQKDGVVVVTIPKARSNSN